MIFNFIAAGRLVWAQTGEKAAILLEIVARYRLEMARKIEVNAFTRVLPRKLLIRVLPQRSPLHRARKGLLLRLSPLQIVVKVFQE